MDSSSVLSQDEKKLGELNLEIQALSTQREVWLSLLKALPTVIIVTSVALMTTLVYATGGSPLGDLGVRVSMVTFLSTSVLWVAALGAVWKSDKVLIEKKGMADRLRSKNERLRATAQEMFVRYKNWMPNGLLQVRAGNLRFEDGGLEPGTVIDWRAQISPTRQRDMEYLDKGLVEEIDLLLVLSRSFIAAFNEFTYAAFEPAKGIASSQLEKTNSGEYLRCAIYAIYRYHIEHDGDAPNRDELSDMLFHELGSRMGDDRLVVLSPDKVLQQVLESSDFREKARKAHQIQQELIGLHSKILIEIRYKYSAET